MNQQEALQYAKGMMDQGMSAAQANTELVRMLGVRLTQGRIDAETRKALMAAVKTGYLGRLPKDGLKPEAFFHPNSLPEAHAQQRNRIANAAIASIQSVCC